MTDIPSSIDAEDEQWVSAAPKGLRIRGVTAVLVSLLFAGAGFWGGAALEHHHGSSSSGFKSSNLSALRSAFSSRGASGFGASGTEGTVTGVVGNTLYITNASGNLVKVQVGSTTTVTRSSAVPLSALQIGDTVVVQGSTASNGSISATSVSATPTTSSSG